MAAVLVAAVGMKLADPRGSSAAMATYGFAQPAGRWIAWGFVLAAEAALAAGVAAGSDSAAYLAAGLMLLFSATLGSALIQGKAGAPCGCFGARSTVGPAAIARNLLLAVGFAAVPALPSESLSTDQWLGLGLLGPGLGGRTGLIEQVEPGPRAELTSTVFTSVGRHVCRTLGPAVDSRGTR